MRNVKDGTSILVMPEVKKVNEVYQNTSTQKIKIMRNVKNGTSILVMPEIKKENEVYQTTST